MKRSTYDQREAQGLLPLLRSISRELLERSETIENMESRLLELRGRGQTKKPSAEFLNLQSELSAQRREVRLARQELGRLGCSLDEDRPLRILIPGRDGNFESGFAWDGTVDRLQSAMAVTT